MSKNLAQAILILCQEIPFENQGVKARLDRAYDIVRMPGYELTRYSNDEDIWTVEKLSTSALGGDPSIYTVVEGQCSCPDGATALGGLCKHVLATRLLALMTAPETITFFDDAANLIRTSEVTAAGFVGDQRWTLTTVKGVRWAVPQGWPNNAAPICEASEPEGYRAIAEAIGA